MKKKASFASLSPKKQLAELKKLTRVVRRENQQLLDAMDKAEAEAAKSESKSKIYYSPTQ